MEVLNEVTLDDLRALVSQEIAKGNESEKQKGRKRLLQVIEGCAADVDAGGGDTTLLHQRAWRIAELRIAGLGGIAGLDPPVLRFEPAPGLTVVRGLNGQGKSSLARSINCALHGNRDAASDIVDGLWAAELITEGEATGNAQLTLISGTARLEIQVSFDRDGEEPTATATLFDGQGSMPVDLRSKWRHALNRGRASYSYDAVQNRLVGSKALQEFLEELLVLGPEWQRVRDAVEAQAAQAVAAQKVFDTAVKDARTAAKSVADRYRTSDPPPDPPPAIDWPRPKPGLDLDAWLLTTGLVDATAHKLPTVASDHEEQIVGLHSELREAERLLEKAETALTGPGMAAALHHIEEIVAVDDLDPELCPVCGSAIDWRTHVRQLTSGLHERTERAQQVMDVIAKIRAWTDDTVVPLLITDVPGGPGDEVDVFQAATARGCHPYSTAHTAARSLIDYLLTKQHQEWLGSVRSVSDAAAKWRSELATVMHEFIAKVRDVTTDAANAGIWKKAQESLNELQVAIRQQRQDAVTEKLHGALARMLPDAAIELTTIQHQGGAKQQRGVHVELTMGGRIATLGMLSSGQRNALLLAPLLVHEAPVPFGFLVVDDPVHALDDTRVDLLAQELARLAEDRQVITLTHDPRLEEYLRARHPDMTVIELQREPATQTVAWTPHTQPWKSLLDDARSIQLSADNDGWGYAEDLASVTAGLCRAAVDGAIRQAVITRAVQRHDDVDAALTALDKATMTSQRIDHVIALAGGKTHLPRLETGRKNYLKFWNKGAHGQLPENADLKATVDAAETACQELAEHDWAGA